MLCKHENRKTNVGQKHPKDISLSTKLKSVTSEATVQFPFSEIETQKLLNSIYKLFRRYLKKIQEILRNVGLIFWWKIVFFFFLYPFWNGNQIRNEFAVCYFLGIVQFFFINLNIESNFLFYFNRYYKYGKYNKYNSRKN